MEFVLSCVEHYTPTTMVQPVTVNIHTLLLCPFNRVKEEAKSEKIKEQAEKIRGKAANIKKNFSLSLSLSLNGIKRRNQCVEGRRSNSSEKEIWEISHNSLTIGMLYFSTYFFFFYIFLLQNVEVTVKCAAVAPSVPRVTLLTTEASDTSLWLQPQMALGRWRPPPCEGTHRNDVMIWRHKPVRDIIRSEYPLMINAC